MVDGTRFAFCLRAGNSRDEGWVLVVVMVPDGRVCAETGAMSVPAPHINTHTVTTHDQRIPSLPWAISKLTKSWWWIIVQERGSVWPERVEGTVSGREVRTGPGWPDGCQHITLPNKEMTHDAKADAVPRLLTYGVLSQRQWQHKLHPSITVLLNVRETKHEAISHHHHIIFTSCNDCHPAVRHDFLEQFTFISLKSGHFLNGNVRGLLIPPRYASKQITSVH